MIWTSLIITLAFLGCAPQVNKSFGPHQLDNDDMETQITQCGNRHMGAKIIHVDEKTVVTCVQIGS